MATLPGGALPLADGGFGDAAPFSLESSSAGGEYVRAYIPISANHRRATTQLRTAEQSLRQP